MLHRSDAGDNGEHADLTVGDGLHIYNKKRRQCKGRRFPSENKKTPLLESFLSVGREALRWRHALTRLIRKPFTALESDIFATSILFRKDLDPYGLSRDCFKTKDRLHP